MNNRPSSPDSSPVNSPLSGKAKSLKARWMKTFEEDSAGPCKDPSTPIENGTEMPGAVVNCNPVPSHAGEMAAHNSIVKPGYFTTEPTMPNFPVHVPAAPMNAAAPPPSLAMPNGLDNSRGVDPSMQTSLGLQYRLAQAQAQLGVLPNAMPMSVEQQSQIIKHAINLEQQSQMIKQAMLLYLAQSELAKETSLASTLAKSNAQSKLLVHGDGIQQGCTSSSDVTNKVTNSKNQSEGAHNGLLLPPPSPQWKTKTAQTAAVSSVPSPPDCQLYPINTTKAHVSQASCENVIITPELGRAMTLERRPSVTQERRPSVTQDRMPCVTHERMPQERRPSVTQDRIPCVTHERMPQERRPSMTQDRMPCVTHERMPQERRPSMTQDRMPCVTHERMPQERFSVSETNCSINSPVQASCHCSQKPTVSTASKVSKDMGIQTDDLASVMPVNSPGKSSIDQALQLLQSSQSNDICRNWLAKHVTETTNQVNHSTVGTVESAANAQESHNSPLELLQASVANSGIVTITPQSCSSPIDMTIQGRKDMMVSSTQCTTAAVDATCTTTSVQDNIDYTTQRPPDNKCPVCADEVSGYHYGIYSCESCKGFFKRTVQSKRNERLRCGRGDSCVIDMDSRKHCAACRFNKCLNLGMKLEAIRGDRQRGGRSMYHGSSEFRRRQELQSQQSVKPPKRRRRTSQVKKVCAPSLTTPVIKEEPRDVTGGGILQPCAAATATAATSSSSSLLPSQDQGPVVPTPSTQSVPELDPLLKELVQAEDQLIDQEGLMECCREVFDQKESNLFSAACHLMDHQLYTFVKWARTLPLYKELKTEDQILLMQRRGLHLMAITLCFYFIDTENRISLPNGQKVVLGSSEEDEDIQDIMQRLVDTAERFRAVNLDKCQLVCLKGIMLLNPVSQGLIEVKRVQEMQEKMEDLLIDYVTSHPHLEDRVTGELLLRLSEIERVCQMIREQVMLRKVEGRLGRYPLLMELFQDKPSWLY